MLSNLPMRLRRHRYGLAATGIIVCAIVVRFVLTVIGWPHNDSEEGTMGLEAMHILQRGEHPVYLYGQHYMGVAEAYLGALFFRLFGISTISLRLGMIAFYGIFLVSIYWLASRLYSYRVAMVSLAILVLGNPFLLQIELLADGGKVETLAFGAVMFAMASWLALSRPVERPPTKQRWLRYLAFAAWGLAAGLGLYTYSIIAPIVVTSGLLLVVICWRELRGLALAFLVIGLLIGLLPVFIYTATMPLKDNPISVFLSLHQSLNTANGPHGWHLLAKQIEATLLYTLPIVTGLSPLYPATALPFYGPLRLATLSSVIIGGGWSLAYLSLLGMATYHPLSMLRKNWILARQDQSTGRSAIAAARSTFASQEGARATTRLMLACAAWLTIGAYMFSATAANNLGSGRYMIGLLIVLPTVLWPLVDWLGRTWTPSIPRVTWMLPSRVWTPFILLLLALNLAVGAVDIAQAVPASRSAYQQDARFTHDLLGKGITRFYSDYWTCDLLIFDTQEKLVCGVTTFFARPGFTRYQPYYAAVQADPRAPYVLVRGSDLEQSFVAHMTQLGLHYSVEYLDGYDIYTPISPSP